MGLFEFLGLKKNNNQTARTKISNNAEQSKMYLSEVKSFIENYPEIVAELKGCTDRQIIDLENKLMIKLPSAYKEFLEWMGVKGGLLLRGSDVYYGYLIGSNWDSPEDSMLKYAIELLDENGFDGKTLLANSIIIMMHQGYTIQFIKTNEGQNPPVYMFSEQGKWLEEGPSKWANSYSEHLLHTFKEEVKAWKKLGYI